MKACVSPVAGGGESCVLFRPLDNGSCQNLAHLHHEDLTAVVAQALGANQRGLPSLLSGPEDLVLQPRGRLNHALLDLVLGEEGLPFLQSQQRQQQQESERWSREVR